MSQFAEDFQPEFSVVIPALEEEAELEETLRRAKAALGPDTELITVDGGSRDQTIQIARGFGRAIVTEPSRGGQLRRGAEEARGKVLIFLHADTWLADGTAAAIRDAIAQGAGTGCLRFAFRPPRRDVRYRLLERGVNWRTRRFATATGDQAIFATRRAYDDSGGFPPIPLFEDIVFVRSVRRITRFVALDVAALTSGRRWERGGFLRTILTHWMLRAAFVAGTDPEVLARFYRRVSRERT